MHDLYNDEIYTVSHCEVLIREAEHERMLTRLKAENKTSPYPEQHPVWHVQVIIQQTADDKKLLMVEVR